MFCLLNFANFSISKDKIFRKKTALLYQQTHADSIHIRFTRPADATFIDVCKSKNRCPKKTIFDFFLFFLFLQFMRPNFWKNGPNDLKITEKIVINEIYI